MNPLTQVKRIQSINAKEADLGISEEASWHAKYRNSAYVYIGLLPYDLTEGDLLAIFAQYGEIVDLNLIRDKGTGKSKGFAFLAYEDQRSTILAVENLNGAQVLGRTIKVDHRGEYKKHEEEDEETKQQKREARGVCRAFQRGECTRGDSCKFSHDEKVRRLSHDFFVRLFFSLFLYGQRAANTGWGHKEDRSSRWNHDSFKKDGTSFGAVERSYSHGERERVEREPRSRDPYDRREQNRSGRLDNSEFTRHNAQDDYIREGKRSTTHDRKSERGHKEREGEGSTRYSENSLRQDRYSSRRDSRGH